MESDRVHYGFVGSLLPFLFIVGSAYVVGNRWYKQVDGRHDFQRVTENQPLPDRVKVGLGN